MTTQDFDLTQENKIEPEVEAKSSVKTSSAAAAAKIEAERVRKIIEQLQAAGSALAIVTNPLRNQNKRFSVLPPPFPYLSLSPLNLSYKADQAASVAATDLMSSSDTAPTRVVLLFN